MRKIEPKTLETSGESLLAPQDHDGVLYHGGDLAAARRLFPQAPEAWIDLSTGINPEPYPVPALAPDVFTRLPANDALAELEAVAARRYGVTPGGAVVAAAGTQALIQLLPQLLKAKRIGILGFTYGEYRRVWRAAGVMPEIVEDLDALARCDLAIIVNPNNPDGRLLAAEDLAALAKHMAGKGGLLVVDEAFADLLPGASLVPMLPESGALVLHSFGKTYGLPGVRLGFAIAGQRLAAQLRQKLGPWPVAGPALVIGQAALTDSIWLASLPRQLSRQASIVAEAMMQCGAEKLGGTPLFQLFAHAEAEKLFTLFGRKGVLLRPFPERPGWLRVGLVAKVDEARLAAVAEAIGRNIRAGGGSPD
ncbi:MAG: threonine-phosphate decarboxylase CobD [Methylovirgula sp.]